VDDDGLRLVEPVASLETAFLEMARDYRHSGENRYQLEPSGEETTFARYLDRIEREARGVRMFFGHVPASTYWLMDDAGAILGVSRLRHELTPGLLKEGGHIGYDVPPSHRRRGYGSLLLKLTLEKAREHGFARVLVTCDTDNTPSARIIQKNGGIFENEVISDYSGKKVSRYWIEIG
jgi:predicted acetyltransferase